jgi:hypothetical protein
VLAKFLQHSLTQKIRIKFAGFCMVGNSFGDSFIDKIAFVAKLLREPFRMRHPRPLGAGIEFGIIQKLRDGHDAASVALPGKQDGHLAAAYTAARNAVPLDPLL